MGHDLLGIEYAHRFSFKKEFPASKPSCMSLQVFWPPIITFSRKFPLLHNSWFLHPAFIVEFLPFFHIIVVATLAQSTLADFSSDMASDTFSNALPSPLFLLFLTISLSPDFLLFFESWSLVIYLLPAFSTHPAYLYRGGSAAFAAWFGFSRFDPGVVFFILWSLPVFCRLRRSDFSVIRSAAVFQIPFASLITVSAQGQGSMLDFLDFSTASTFTDSVPVCFLPFIPLLIILTPGPASCLDFWLMVITSGLISPLLVVPWLFTVKLFASLGRWSLVIFNLVTILLRFDLWCLAVAIPAHIKGVYLAGNVAYDAWSMSLTGHKLPVCLHFR